MDLADGIAARWLENPLPAKSRQDGRARLAGADVSARPQTSPRRRAHLAAGRRGVAAGCVRAPY